MKPQSIELFKKLESSLDDLIKVYRHLLNVVRQERQILIAAKLDDLNENNRNKETTLVRASQLEEARIKITAELTASEGLDQPTKLLDLARHVGGEIGDRLRSRQSVLELLLKRVRDHNQQNETLVNSALDAITGGIGSIRDLLKDKPTYKKTGGIDSRPTEAGQLVRKEA